MPRRRVYPCIKTISMANTASFDCAPGRARSAYVERAGDAVERLDPKLGLKWSKLRLEPGDEALDQSGAMREVGGRVERRVPGMDATPLVLHRSWISAVTVPAGWCKRASAPCMSTTSERSS